MKKKSICILGLIFMLTACTNETNVSSISPEENNLVQSVQQEVSETETQQEDTTESFWNQSTTDNSEDTNVLNFVNGLQIILPEDWNGKIVTSASTPFNYGDTLIISEKRNAEAGVGGVLLYLDYINRNISLEYPYQIYQVDTVLGVYKQEDEEYALILRMPREMNYVEGNEEMKQVYEDLKASIDKVQIVTDNISGFTECGIDSVDWIQYEE